MNNFEPLYQRAINSNIWVIKIGSAMLTNHGKTIDKAQINEWAKQINTLRSAGKQIILVSSGAIAAGMQKLGKTEKPKSLNQQQALAAVGQMTLAKIYEEVFALFNIQTAQILLTHDDAADRKRYLNIKGTINALLADNILPIINENDTTSFDEIKFGDNDNLGALVANLVNAGLYIILTDQEGLYNKDPRKHSDASLIDFDFANNPKLDDYIGSSISSLGSGGMLTKLQAARKAMNSGTATAIMHGQAANGLIDLFNQQKIGTLLLPNQPVKAKKQWLAGQQQTKGDIIVDEGAKNALINQNKSLLAAGICDVVGDFSRGEIVAIKDKNHQELAKGICNYNSKALKKIKGLSSQSIESTLGYRLENHVIHRDNLVLT